MCAICWAGFIFLVYKHQKNIEFICDAQLHVHSILRWMKLKGEIQSRDCILYTYLWPIAMLVLYQWYIHIRYIYAIQIFMRFFSTFRSMWWKILLSLWCIIFSSFFFAVVWSEWILFLNEKPLRYIYRSMKMRNVDFECVFWLFCLILIDNPCNYWRNDAKCYGKFHFKSHFCWN